MGIAETSAAEGMLSTAPRRSRLILPSNAFGLARNSAIIILVSSESPRAPTRRATARSVVLALTLTVLGATAWRAELFGRPGCGTVCTGALEPATGGSDTGGATVAGASAAGANSAT